MNPLKLIEGILTVNATRAILKIGQSSDLKRATNNNSFFVNYSPVFSLLEVVFGLNYCCTLAVPGIVI